MRLIGALALLAIAAFLGLLAIAWARVATIDVAALARRDPGVTAVMREREAEAREHGRAWHPLRRWVPYEAISPLLRRAVLIAEDDAFYAHDGLDWNEIRASARRDLAAGRIVRGGSTITQQLAKNLWLGSARTPLRKLEEMLLALRLERALGKKRIFELYLNEIEWGDGIFGVEAAANRWFHCSAAVLGPRQSVRLAAVIINPRRFSPIDPPRRIARRARIIATRMRRRGELSDADWRDVMGIAPPPLVVQPVAPETTLGAQPDTLILR